MKVALTIPSAGAGRWCWQGWANAFKWFGWEAINIADPRINLEQVDPDLLITTTSQPRDDVINWRKNNPNKHLALNVLAWTDRDLPCINNVGVQATAGNLEYANALQPNLVFAQYSEAWRKKLLGKWKDEGFELGSMEMAADAVVYPFMREEPNRELDIFYVGGRWAYKAENLDAYLLPVFKTFTNHKVVGKGWPFLTTDMSEKDVGKNFRNAKVSPNMHEPHSTKGGYDVVERVFKTLYCGGLCVTDYVQEMEDGFGLNDGYHLLYARNPEEYLDICQAAVERNGHFNGCRKIGQRYVALYHTYFNRVANLFLDLNMITEYCSAIIKLEKWYKEMELV